MGRVTITCHCKCYVKTVKEGSVGGDLVPHRLSIFEEDSVSYLLVILYLETAWEPDMSKGDI